MKKGLLLSLLLTLSIGACGSNQSSEEPLEGNSIVTSYYDFDFYIDNARHQLESSCEYALGNIDDEELIDLIYYFYENENGYLDSIVDIYEASEALSTIKTHEMEYIRDYFGVILNTRIDEHAKPYIDSVNLPIAKNQIIDFVNDVKNRISYGNLGFVGTFNEYAKFMWEFEAEVIYIVWSNGGSWDPDQPVGPDVNKWQDHIDELYDYATEIMDKIREYCDFDLCDFASGLIDQFEECVTIHDANYLLYDLKGTVYAKALLELKECLCNLFADFVDYVQRYDKDEESRDSIARNADGVNLEIYKCDSIESAIIEFENSIYHSKEIIWGNYRTTTLHFLDEMFEHYWEALGEDDAKKFELAKTYSLYCDRISRLSGEIEYLDEYANEILDEFFSYCEELVYGYIL